MRLKRQNITYMTKFSSEVEVANALATSYQDLKSEISKVVIGQDEVVRQVLTAIFCQGHSLLIGVPGCEPNAVQGLGISQTVDRLQLSRQRGEPADPWGC